jgi:hypothetical protein
VDRKFEASKLRGRRSCVSCRGAYSERKASVP